MKPKGKEYATSPNRKNEEEGYCMVGESQMQET